MNPIVLIMRLTGLSRALSIAVLVVSLLAAAWAAKALYDRSVITAHDVKVSAKVQAADAKANAAADKARVEDSARTATEAAQLEGIRNENATAPVSDHDRARYECIRLQQQARKIGSQPPTCR